MTKTLLFDLDDTLLGNPMQEFVPQYTHSLAARIAPGKHEELIRQLFIATKGMVQNLQADRTLEETFDESFFPALHTERRILQQEIDRYYAEDYPKLVKVTEQREEAVQIVKEALRRGWQIAVATNPLFPYTAIYQRLCWAKLTGKEYPWIVIPGYETFHFSKPNLEYFAEILGQIGWPEDPVVMVGNDKEMDIDSASAFGLPTYWVNPGSTEEDIETTTRHAQGHLKDLFVWLDHQTNENLLFSGSTNRALLAVIRSSIGVLSTLTKNLTPSNWTEKYSPDEWSMTEIVCHLRDVEAEVNLPRIETVLLEKNPFITGKDTDIWAKERKYNQQDGLKALNSFIKTRMKLISILEELDEDGWNLSARHSIFGPIQLSELVKFTASHDKLHIRTIFELIKLMNDSGNREKL